MFGIICWNIYSFTREPRKFDNIRRRPFDANAVLVRTTPNNNAAVGSVAQSSAKSQQGGDARSRHQLKHVTESASRKLNVGHLPKKAGKQPTNNGRIGFRGRVLRTDSQRVRDATKLLRLMALIAMDKRNRLRVSEHPRMSLIERVSKPRYIWWLILWNGYIVDWNIINITSSYVKYTI